MQLLQKVIFLISEFLYLYFSLNAVSSCMLVIWRKVDDQGLLNNSGHDF